MQWKIDLHSFIHLKSNTISCIIRAKVLYTSPVILKVLSEELGFLIPYKRVHEV